MRSSRPAPAASNSLTNQGLPPDRWCRSSKDIAGSLRSTTSSPSSRWRTSAPTASRVSGATGITVVSRTRSSIAAARGPSRSTTGRIVSTICTALAISERARKRVSNSAPTSIVCALIDHDQQRPIPGSQCEGVGNRSEGDESLLLIGGRTLAERGHIQLLEHALPRPQRGRATVAPSGSPRTAETFGASDAERLGREPGLADARRAHDTRGATDTFGGGRKHLAQHRHVVLAPDQRQRASSGRHRATLLRSGRRPHGS